MRFLIIRPGAIGDSLLTFPVLQALRARVDQPWVTLVSNPAILPLAQALGLAEEVSDYGDARWSQLFLATHQLTGNRDPLADRLHHFDRAIGWLRDPDGVVEHNLRAAGIASVDMAPGRPPQGQRLHIVQYLAHTVNVEVEMGQIVYQLPQSVKPSEQPIIAIHPGSGGRHKCWPASSFAAVITQLWKRGISVLLLAGPADQETLTATLSYLASPPNPAQLRLLVNAPLLEVAQQIQQCQGYLGNDSGLTHLAALLGVPTLALFGPSDPLIWRPVGPVVHVQHEPALENLPADVIMNMVELLIGNRSQKSRHGNTGKNDLPS